MKSFIFGGIAVLLMMPVFAIAGQYDHEDFRFPREQSVTKDGYPTPLSGQPITKTPVIVKKTGVTLKKYPEHYIPPMEVRYGLRWLPGSIQILKWITSSTAGLCPMCSVKYSLRNNEISSV